MTQTVSFTDLLTASDSDLVRYFYKIKSDPQDDFIIRINKAAAQLGLNHTQLICALGFNRSMRDLTDIHSILGFKSYKLLMYRTNELFRTDTYKQLAIENVIDIYSERLQYQAIFESIRELLMPRLTNIESALAKSDDAALVISYRMEVHAIYMAGLADQQFAEERLNADIGHHRLLAGEVNTIADSSLIPPSNMFFMDSLLPAEKQALIDKKHINQSMIENRLTNARISTAERDLLENYI